MSDKQTKLPAHEVIVEMIQETLNDLSGVDEDAGEVGRHMAKIETLSQVMRRMMIPDHCRDEIIDGLDRAYRVPLTVSVAEQVLVHINGLAGMLEQDDL